MVKAAATATATALPRLRDDLRIEPAAPLLDGAPCWTLTDPLAQRYFQLGAREVQLLSHWTRGTHEALAGVLQRRGVALTEGELERLLQFLLDNGLVEVDSARTAERLATRRAASHATGLTWLLHHYLFFKFPLLRPEAFLRRTLPLVQQLWSRPARLALALIGLTGAYLVSRQWDAYLSTFAEFLSWQGLLAYLTGAVLVKTAHEFGHAYAATYFGCRVPTMGVAVMMGLPMLYSDTSASWRLTQRIPRLWIDAAGMLAELGVAVLATFLWAFLPDGGVRGAVFVLATSSWLMSLAVNLNPFMRFDGYYLLSDAVGLPNLQPRAFALARWHLRECLLRLGETPPEPLPARVQRGMVIYAWAVWVYRLVLYTGIALAVYHWFFKAMGVAMFLVEAGWFIVRPVAAELRQWWARRQVLSHSPRAWVSLVALGGVLLLGVLPLDRVVRLPALLAPTLDVPLYADVAARIDEVLVQEGQAVRSGQLLLRLSAPTLAQERAQAQTRLAAARARLDRMAGTPRDLAQSMVLVREWQMQQRTLQSLDEQQARLEVRAPFDGRVVEVDADLQPGRWVDRHLALGRVVSGDRYDVRAYVPETEVWRLHSGQIGQFIPDDARRDRVSARLSEIGQQAVDSIEMAALSVAYDGPIATRDESTHGLRPVQAQYHVRLQPETGGIGLPRADHPEQIKGEVRLDAQPQSLLSMAAAQVLRVLAREADL
ncbi:MAG: hypothetical protein RL260_2968 [Pseudomonadota bacterium]|jgi:putative peptide zinc metalloprotease protein